MKISIYTREKKDSGRWRYERVNIGRGRRPANLQGPFYLRHTTPEGKQAFTPAGDDLDTAIKSVDTLVSRTWLLMIRVTETFYAMPESWWRIELSAVNRAKVYCCRGEA